MLERILVLGATGFIGGTVLRTLCDQFGSGFITALIRDDSEGTRSKILQSKLGCTTATFSSLDATDELQAIVAEYDIVVNAADACDHVPSAVAITKGLSVRGGLLIHVSGTGVIMDDAQGKADPDGTTVLSDVDYNKIDAIPDSQIHRDVDLVVARADGVDGVITVTVVPPLVYGLGTGCFKRHSGQVPGLVRRALKREKAEFIGDGEAKWSHVHVQDLANAFTIIIHRFQKNRASVDTGSKGYIFAESGELSWKEMAQGVADAVNRTKDAPDCEKGAVSLTAEEAAIQFPNQLGRTYYSSNSRSRAVKLRRWGWETPNGIQTPLLQDLDREVLFQMEWLAQEKK